MADLFPDPEVNVGGAWRHALQDHISWLQGSTGDSPQPVPVPLPYQWYPLPLSSSRFSCLLMPASSIGKSTPPRISTRCKRTYGCWRNGWTPGACTSMPANVTPSAFNTLPPSSISCTVPSYNRYANAHRPAKTLPTWPSSNPFWSMALPCGTPTWKRTSTSWSTPSTMQHASSWVTTGPQPLAASPD